MLEDIVDDSITLDDQIDALQNEIYRELGNDDKRQTLLIQNMETLYKIKQNEESIKLAYRKAELDELNQALDRKLKEAELINKSRIDRNTWLKVGAQILGILLIIGHEETHVLTSKALGFVTKP